MAIRRTKYNHTIENGLDTFHFQTDDKQVKILDSNNNELGSFKEFGMEGKVVESGNFRDLRVTGIYKVSGLSGLPSGFDSNKISILSVKSVGEINNPDFSYYTLISDDGEVYENTVVGSRQSGWTNTGGQSLENRISNILTSVGQTGNLATNAKSSIVNAVNEVHNRSTENRSRVDNLRSEFNNYQSHNHDNRYVNISGATMTGNLSMENGRYVRGRSANGSATYNLLGVNNSNQVVVGGSSRPIVLNSEDIRNSNGDRLWHTGNMGDGSGADADMLDGFQGSEYARLGRANSFRQQLTIDNRENSSAGILFRSSQPGTQKIRWEDSNSRSLGEVNFNGLGDFIVRNRFDRQQLRIRESGILETRHEIRVNTRGRDIEPVIRLQSQHHSATGGIGFAVQRQSGHFVLHDWDRNGNIFRYDPDENFLRINRVAVQGRRIFMQNNRPTGSIPTGSVWIS